LGVDTGVDGAENLGTEGDGIFGCLIGVGWYTMRLPMMQAAMRQASEVVRMKSPDVGKPAAEAA